MADLESDLGSAAVLFLPFVGVFLLLQQVDPPSSSQLLASDPLVQLVAAFAGLGAIAVLSALPPLVWLVVSRPTRATLARSVRGAVPALVVVGVGLPLLRLLVGPTLPAFVPPEESALPGFALGLGAGILEEAVFRFGVLAAVYVAARRVGSRSQAMILAVVVASLAFASSHELGPGASGFDARFFLTRFLVPGCVMSLLFFRPGPSFLVTLHCAAHLGIALLFSGSPPAAG